MEGSGWKRGLTALVVLICLIASVKYIDMSATVDRLYDENEALRLEVRNQMSELMSHQRDHYELLKAYAATLPAPVEADTNELSVLVEQLADGDYVVQREKDGSFRYCRVPEGYLTNRLDSYCNTVYEPAQLVDADGNLFTEVGESYSNWVVRQDCIVGIGFSIGFINRDGGLTGAPLDFPDDFSQFVKAFFVRS